MDSEQDRHITAVRYLAEGADCEGQRDWLGAISKYRQVVALVPEHPRARYFGHNNLAYSLIQLGEYSEAEMHCHIAISINGKRHNAHKNLGLALQGLKRFSEAAYSLLTAAQLAPADQRAMQHLRDLVTANPDVLATCPDLYVAMKQAAKRVGQYAV